MRRTISPKLTLVLAGAALLLAACSPAKLDVRDPKSVALTFVDAYNKRDVQTLMQLINPDHRPEFEGPLTDGEKSPDWRIMFEPGIAKVFAGSKGLEGPRYDESGGMFFGVSRQDEGRVQMLQVMKAFGAYYVTDVLSHDAAEFAAMATTPPVSDE